MKRRLLPSVLTAVALVGIPTLAAAAATGAATAGSAGAACAPDVADQSTPPTTSDDTDTGGDDDSADDDAPVSADWDDRCDIDPEAYFLDYDSADYDASTTATGGALPTTTPPAGVPNATAVPTPLPQVATEDAADRTATAEVVPAPPDASPSEPGILDDNTFVDEGESSWVAVDDDRESTFGLDVDTGSFTVAETFVDEGYQPEPDSIRAEEWVNSFEYGDVNDGPEALAIDTEGAVGDDDLARVRIGISTEELAAEDRPPANITFVIDTSGSMDIRERLGLVRASLALLTRNLRPDDTVSIVTYGSEAQALLPPTPVEDWRTIIGAIEQLEPEGSTNMEAGLRLGYEQARAAYDPEALNVVVLASDGVANVGDTGPDSLTAEITRSGEEGIQLVTVGYGMGNYNDHLMEQLANQGDGFYSYVNTYGDAVELFVDDLTPTLTVVAKDAKVQVVFDDEVIVRYRLIGYENRALDDSDFRDDTVDAGELGAGHHATAIYEIELVDPTAAADVEIGEVRLRWADPVTGDVTEATTPLIVGADEASPTLRFASLVANSAEYFRGDSDIADRGITLDDLIAEGEALAELGVDGADDFAEFLTTASQAQPPTGVYIDD